MAQLSVNINKIATLRNSRGCNVPNLLKVATDLQKFGAQGITIHPRPDQRHILYDDAMSLSKLQPHWVYLALKPSLISSRPSSSLSWNNR